MRDSSFRALVVLSTASALLAPQSRLVRRVRTARALSPDDEDGVVYQSPSYYADALCGPDDDEEDEEDALCLLPESDSFCVAVLGDLHIDPRKMDDYEEGRGHFLPLLEDASSRGVATAVVSLGDLGESKSVRPDETAELFAGTTECHELAAEFLGSFGTEYEVR